MSLGQRFRRARRRLMFVSLRRLLRVTGLKQARTIGNWLGDLQFHVARQRRLRLQGDVAAALGRSTDDPGVPALLREAYRVNNGAVLEIVSMFDHRHDEDELASMCELDGLEHLRAAMTAGRGAILLATHMGNAALVPVRLAKAGWSVSVVYREARMMTAGFLQTGFELYGIQGILANAGIRAYAQMLSALKQGRVVFVMLDQGVKRAEDGQMQRFLGKNTAMPAGPAQLARASRAPVLPLVTTAATPKWKFSIDPPVPLGQGSIESDVLTLVALTERQILQAPQLWSWHHRRWRHLPRAAALPSSPGAGD